MPEITVAETAGGEAGGESALRAAVGGADRASSGNEAGGEKALRAALGGTDRASCASEPDNPERPRLLRDERGMTIVELLTALVILTMVCSILMSFLLMGISMYKRMTAESQIRNQGDAIVSQVISELKDAVYAAQGASTDEIVFVRRALKPDGAFDNEAYVDSFKMRIEPALQTDRYGIGVYAVTPEGETLVKRFDLPNPFTLQTPDESLTGAAAVAEPQGLTVVHDRLVDVRLRYVKRVEADTRTGAAENPGYELHTRIPLFRAD